MGDVTIDNIWIFLYMKQIDLLLLWVCTVIYHRRHQINVARTSVTHLAAPHMPLFVFTTFWHYLWSITVIKQMHDNMESICSEFVCHVLDDHKSHCWPNCKFCQMNTSPVISSWTFQTVVILNTFCGPK